MLSTEKLERYAQDCLLMAGNESGKVRQFCLLWSGAVRPALSYAETSSGDETRSRIVQLTVAAEGICAGESGALAQFFEIWHCAQIKHMLQAIQYVTGPTMNTAITQFIELAERIQTIFVIPPMESASLQHASNR